MRPEWPLAAVLVAVLVSAVGPAPAGAHGPCGCLDPRLPQAGNPVAIVAGYPTYRVVFNPRSRDLAIAPRYLASAYRPGVATTTVLSRPRDHPLRRARFRVPAATPPGVYLVLIFDGGEGGAHNTWEYLHVTGADRPAAWAQHSPSSVSSPDPWALLAAAALGALVTGAALTLRRRRS